MYGHIERTARRLARGRYRGPTQRLRRDDLRFLVLSLLSQGPAHGYDLTRALDARTKGAYAPAPAEIYPTLAMLEDEGFIDATSDPDGRKLYAVNEYGLAALADEKAAADAAFARLDAMTGGYRRFNEGAEGVFHHIAAALGLTRPAAARKDF